MSSSKTDGLRILGATLQQLLLSDGVANVSSPVPFWIKYSCKALLVKDTFQERLWMHTGVVDDIPKLLANIETSVESLNIRPYSALTIGRVLVLYFKTLPTPLLTFELHDQLIAAAQLEIFQNPLQRLQFICDLLKTLPSPNYYTLKKLLRVFAKIWKEQNKDTQRSTIEIWGPILLLRENVHDMASDIPWACHLLRILIENHEYIFPRGQSSHKSPFNSPSNSIPVLGDPLSTPIENGPTVGNAVKSSSIDNILSSFQSKSGLLGAQIAGQHTSAPNSPTSRPEIDVRLYNTTNYMNKRVEGTQRLSLSWLGTINTEKVEKMQQYLDKMYLMFGDMAKWAKEHGMYDVVATMPNSSTKIGSNQTTSLQAADHPASGKILNTTSSDSSFSTSSVHPNTIIAIVEKDKDEIYHCLSLSIIKLNSVLEALSLNPKVLTRLIDSYHLDRCHSYVIDLHTSLIKYKEEEKFMMYFESRMMNGTLQRLYLTLQTEMSLFFISVDELLGGSITNDPRNQMKFKKHTIDLIQDPNGKRLWLEKFGLQTFAVRYEHFIRHLLSATSNISSLYNSTEQKNKVMESLRMVLDDACTGYVTVAKFAKFLEGFGDLHTCVHTCHAIVSKPWFHGYVSRREATRLLEPYESSTFLIRFSKLDPSSFAVNFKDENNQLYNIHVGVTRVSVDSNDTESSDSKNLASTSHPKLTRKPSFNSAKEKKPSSSSTILSPREKEQLKATAFNNELKELVSHAATPTRIVFNVKEGEENRVFDSMEEMIEYFSDFLKFPLTSKLMMQPWFFGEFSSKDSAMYLQHEPIGTFLVRFSSHHAKLALDYVSEDGRVIQHRLERTNEGKIVSGNLLFEDIEHFVSETKVLKYPYNHDNRVSMTQEEDHARVSQMSFISMLEDQEISASDHILSDLALLPSKTSPKSNQATPSSNIQTDKVYRSPSIIRLNQSISVSLFCHKLAIDDLTGQQLSLIASERYGPIGPSFNDSKSKLEETLFGLLFKFGSKIPLTIEEEAKMFVLSFATDFETFQTIQKKVHAKICGSSLLKSKGVQVSEHVFYSKQVPLYTLHQYQFRIKNKNRSEIKYVTETSQTISTNGFVAISSQEGIIQAGESQILTISVVLFKPCVIRDIITLHCSSTSKTASDAQNESFALLLTVIPDRSSLEEAIEPYWKIPDEFMTNLYDNMLSKRLGHGGSADVYLTNLYGVKVAAKLWDLGAKDMPPAGFNQELSIMSRMRHPNLVRFIGAISGVGVACLVMEYVSGGSLDKYMNFKLPDTSPDSLDNPSSPSLIANSRESSNKNAEDISAVVKIKNLNLSNSPNLSVIERDGTRDDYEVIVEEESTGDSKTFAKDPNDPSSSNSSPALHPHLNSSPESLIGISNFSNRIPIAVDIAKALLYLHENNLIHRDVKSLNVLINKGNHQVRLADFGEAAFKDASRNESVGSSLWMAPEVCMSQVYSTKADVFSFGLVLYELLMESHPLRSLHMIAEGLIPEIPAKYSLEFPSYVRLIQACTLQNPDKRPTMFSVVRELEKIRATTHIRKVRMGMRK